MMGGMTDPKGGAKKVARPAGIEPTTHCLEGSCSIQLSYGRNRSTYLVRYVPSGLFYARIRPGGK